MKSVSKTAYATMYARIFSDIPLSRDIYNQFSDSDIEQILPIRDKFPLLSPELEYRYKLVDQALLQKMNQLTIELGAGFSPRGITFSKKGYSYIEIELDEISEIKNRIARNLASKDLEIIGGDILCQKTWDRIDSLCSGMSVTFLNEGLMRYLNKEQKGFILSNVKNIIKKNNGRWLTADVTLKKLIEHQNQNNLLGTGDISGTISQIDSSNMFSSLYDAIDFFEKSISMDVVEFPPDEIHLESPNFLGISYNEVKSLIENVKVVGTKIDETAM